MLVSQRPLGTQGMMVSDQGLGMAAAAVELGEEDLRRIEEAFPEGTAASVRYAPEQLRALRR